MARRRVPTPFPPGIFPVAAALTAAGAAGGCPPAPPPAPQTLDELARWSLRAYDVGEADEDAVRALAVDNLVLWYGTFPVQSEQGGSLADLAAADLAGFVAELVGDPDPALAVGVYLLRRLPCTLGQVEEIYLDPDQSARYPGSYSSYVRDFDADPGCFARGDCDALDWSSEVVKEVVASFEYRMRSGLRRWRLAREPGDDGPDVVLASRTFMPEPAVPSVEGLGGFEQTYQIEVFAPWDGDEVVHLYAFWSESWLAFDGADDAWWANQYLEGLIDWDERTAEMCTDGYP